MAAARDSIKSLCGEVTCSLCRDYFKDPVTIPECGHNFCRSCLRRGRRKLKTEVSCPWCRITVQKGSPISNWNLANVAKIAKKLSPHLGEGKVCEKHQKTLKLFCKDHETPICVLCDSSKEHENHKVIPLEEAAKEYKGEICSRLEILRKEQETIRASVLDLEKESQDLLKLTETEKQRAVEKFRQLRQFLEEQEKGLLHEIEQMEKEVAWEKDEQLVRLSWKLCSLERTIQEMEKKQQKPASELLQDVRSTLQRYEERKRLETPWAFPAQLKGKASRFCDIDRIIENVMKQFKANVTLDPDTAHPSLILSQDRKSVKMGDKPQALPNNPERFRHQVSVLGCEGFTAGRHFWEVTVESGEWWAVGVTRKTLRRKGTKYSFRPGEGVWAVQKRGSQYLACTSPPSFLSLSEEPKRIRVTLDFEGGHVSFFDTDSGAELYTFSGASFSRETLLPFFNLFDNKTHLRIS